MTSISKSGTQASDLTTYIQNFTQKREIEQSSQNCYRLNSYLSLCFFSLEQKCEDCLKLFFFFLPLEGVIDMCHGLGCLLPEHDKGILDISNGQNISFAYFSRIKILLINHLDACVAETIA